MSPKLYPEVYIPKLQQSHLGIGISGGVLYDHTSEVSAQLKELTRLGIGAIIYHNLPPNQRNNRLLQEIRSVSPDLSIEPLSDHENLYQTSIQRHSLQGANNPLVFIEKNYLQKTDKSRLNLISLGEDGSSRYNLDEIIQSTSQRANIAMMQEAVASGHISRIHLIPIRTPHALKHELLSLDGSGTLIEKDFIPKLHEADEHDKEALYLLYRTHRYSGQLKPRSREYISENIGRFIVAEIDTIPVGCVEIIPIDDSTIELGGIAVNLNFMDFRIGKMLVDAVEEYAYLQSKHIISVTANQKFARMLTNRGYIDGSIQYQERANQSPTKKLFFKSSDSLTIS